jgi:hypothetical protein
MCNSVTVCDHVLLLVTMCYCVLLCVITGNNVLLLCVIMCYYGMEAQKHIEAVEADHQHRVSTCSV